MESELRAVVLATNVSLDELREAHELLKKNHARALDKLAAADQRAQDAEASREQIQAECRAMYQEWSSQLANQAQEFKNLESQMVPQHIVHREKIELGNQLRSKYEKECNLLRTQIETARETLNVSKKQAQDYKIRWENASSELEIRQARMFKTISSQQADLDVQNKRIEDMDNNISELNDAIRLLETRIIDLTVSESHLRLEQESASRIAEESIQGKCLLELSHQRTVKELQSQCSLLEAQIDCHKVNAEEATALKEQALEQLKQSEIKVRQYRIDVVEYQQNLEESRSQSDAQKQAYDKDMLIARERLASLQSQFESQILEYQNRVGDSERHEELLRNEHDRRDKERDVQFHMELERVKDLLAQAQNQASKMHTEVQRSSEEVSKQTASSEQKIVRIVQENNELKASIEKLTQTLNVQVHQNEQLHSEVRVLQEAQQEHSKKYSSNLLQLKESKESLAKQTDQNERLLESIQRLEEKVKTVGEESTRQSQNWQSEREVLIHELKATELRGNKLDVHIRVLKAEANELQNALKSSTEKSRKDRQHHKQLAKNLRDRIANLLSELAVLKEVQGYCFQEVSMWKAAGGNAHIYSGNAERTPAMHDGVSVDLRTFEKDDKDLGKDLHAFEGPIQK